MQLADSWEGTGSQAALDEASAIISKHEANATAAGATADKLRKMEASVVKTKEAANRTAEDVQDYCERSNNTNLRGEVRATRIAERIASGLAENIGDVSANTMELAGNLDVPEGTPGADGKMPAAPPPDVPAAARNRARRNTHSNRLQTAAGTAGRPRRTQQARRNTHSNRLQTAAGTAGRPRRTQQARRNTHSNRLQTAAGTAGRPGRTQQARRDTHSNRPQPAAAPEASIACGSAFSSSTGRPRFAGIACNVNWGWWFGWRAGFAAWTCWAVAIDVKPKPEPEHQPFKRSVGAACIKRGYTAGG